MSLPAGDKAALLLAAVLEAMLLAVLGPVLLVALASSEWRKRQADRQGSRFRHEPEQSPS